MSPASSIESDRLVGVLDAVVTAAELGQVSFKDLAKIAGLDPQVDFVGANLPEVDLRDEALGGFNFSGAELTGADFRRAGVEGALFLGAELTGAVGLPPDIDPHGRGMAAATNENWQEAASAFDTAAAAADIFGDAEGAAIEFMSAGFALRQLGRANDAGQRFTSAFERWNKLHHLTRAFCAWNAANDSLLKAGTHRKAEKLFSRAMRSNIRDLLVPTRKRGRTILYPKLPNYIHVYKGLEDKDISPHAKDFILDEHLTFLGSNRTLGDLGRGRGAHLYDLSVGIFGDTALIVAQEPAEQLEIVSNWRRSALSIY